MSDGYRLLITGVGYKLVRVLDVNPDMRGRVWASKFVAVANRWTQPAKVLVSTLVDPRDGEQLKKLRDLRRKAGV